MQIQDNAACAFVTNVAGKDVREEGGVLKLPLHLHNSTNPKSASCSFTYQSDLAFLFPYKITDFSGSAIIECFHLDLNVFFQFHVTLS